jgi:RHS repeat-associated protein
MALRRRSDVTLWRQIRRSRVYHTIGHLAPRTFWFVCLGMLVLSLEFFDTTMAYATPATPHVVLQGSPSTPNTMNPATGTTSHPSASPTPTTSSTKPSAPQVINHPMQMPMQAGSVELHAGQAADFRGSDGHLELRVPANAITAQDVTQAGGHISLKVTQVAPASGSNAGGSGEYSLGTYLLQLVDAKGRLLSHGLRKPLTALYHFQNGETGLYTGNASLLLNSSVPAGATNMPGVVKPAARTNLASTMGKPQAEQATLDPSANALTASPLVSTPTSTLGWDSDSPIATFGKPDPTSVNLSAGALTDSYPIAVPNGPGGLTPSISLSYSSEAVNEQHNVSGAAGWVGEGWDLSMGAITWSEQNVLAGCITPSCGGPKWQSVWQFSDAFGTSSELIPPDQQVSTYTDDTPNKYCATGQSPSSPCPILWHTATESYDKIYAYVGSVQIPGQTVNPPCFRAWRPDGVMEEFGCTPDSLQYYYEAGVGALVTGWNLDLITDPQGNQIHLNYQQDMASWTDPTTHQTKMFPRDVELSSISYDSPTCHNAQTMCTGNQWQPLMQVIFNAAHTVSQLTGAQPTGCNPDENMRCDDPLDLSSTGGMAASLVQNTLVLNSAQVQVRTNGAMPWNTLNTYSLSYEQSGPSTITDPVSGMQRSTAGMLDLTRIQESGALSGSALLYSGRKIGADQGYAYLKVFDLSQQHLTVGPHTTLSYWIYPQSQAQNSGVDGENSTCAALDLVFSDGTTLHDSNAVDQYGHGMNPIQQCGQLKLDQWNLITTDVGTVAQGKTVSRIDVGYDPPVFTGGYRGYIDDVSLSNPGDSTNKPLFASSFEPGQPQPTWTNVVVSQSYNITGFCCGLTGPEAGVRQEIFHTGNTTSSASLPPVNFTYTSQTNTYVDSFFPATPLLTNCGPSWNTGCLLWSQSVAGNDRFISTINNGQGLEQRFTWSIAHNNTHGAPGGGDNNANPFACDANQNGYPCNEADDSGWSHAVLTREDATTIRSTQQGQAGIPVTETTDYSYKLTYPLLAQECADCVAGMYWGDQNDANFLGYYNGMFMGFAQATVDLPDGSVVVHDFEAGEGWGIYDTTRVGCFTIPRAPCHNDPWWDLANAAHGAEIEMQQYDTDGKTLLKQVNTSYTATCPPEGVSPTPPFGNFNFDGKLVSTLDINNPVAVCAIQQTQQTTQTFDGSTNPVSQTTNWTYDRFGRVTQQKTTGNSGTPNTVVQNTSYIWNDGITATKNSATGTYIINTQAFTDTEDGSNNRLACTEMSYDGQPFTTGQSNRLTGGLQTSKTGYAQCGTSANHYAQSGASTTTTIYDRYGNAIATDDADANAGIAGHTGCTVNHAQYSACTSYDSRFEAFQTASANALNQTNHTSYANTSAQYGFGTLAASTTDANGQTTSYTYDALGRMTGETEPGETSGKQTKQWSYTYWCSDTSADAPCVEIDETDRLDSNTTVISRYFYDGEGRLVETRTPGINGKDVVIYADYDTSGRQIFKSNSYFVPAYTGKPGPSAYSIPDGTQPGTITKYLNLRQTQVTDPNSHISTTTKSVVCGVAGTHDTGCYEQSATVDANGHQTAMLTGALGQTNYTQTYTGTSNSSYTFYTTTATTYDAAGDLLTTVSPDGTTTSSAYDDLGQIIRQIDPDTGTTTATYDPDGNQIKLVDARGSAGTTYTGYDGLDRPLWNNSSNSAREAWVTFTYDSTAHGNDGVGELTGEHFTGSGSLSGSYAFTYDARGQQAGETVTVNGTSYPLQASYNDNGQVTSETYSTGEITTLGYSSTGWLDGLSTTANGVTTALASNIAYDGLAGAASQITSMNLGDSTYTYKAGYDTGIRLTSESLSTAGGGMSLYQTQPTYDAADNIVGVKSSLSGQTDLQQFCYDELNRLTWSGTRGTPPCSGVSVPPGTLTAAGYQQSESYNGEGQLTSGPSGSYTYGDRNHPHAVTSTSTGFSASYDAAGNPICRALNQPTSCGGSSSNGQVLTYDIQGRLSTWENKVVSPTQTEDALYDGAGNRVATLSTSNHDGTTLTVYIGNLEEVQMAPSGTKTTTYYTVGGQRIAARVNGTLYYFGYDALGSQIAVLNTSGNLVGAQLYGPYGSSRYSTGMLPTSVGFTGQHADSVTGLDYDVARYYDPTIGQFLTPDSVQGNAQGVDPYAYVGDNPETLTDPTGQASCVSICFLPEPGPGIIPGPYPEPGPGIIPGPYPEPGPGIIPGPYPEPGPGIILGPIPEPGPGIILGPIPEPGPGIILGPIPEPGPGIILGPIPEPGPGIILGPIPEPGPGIYITTPGPEPLGGINFSNEQGEVPEENPEVVPGDRLPDRVPKSPTRGVLVTNDHPEGIDLISGGKGGPVQNMPPDTPGMVQQMQRRTDVEPQAAALMRQEDIDEATLYINNTPCEGPLGCDENLPHMLPEGARLTVYIKDAERGIEPWEKREYIGLPDSEWQWPPPRMRRP